MKLISQLERVPRFYLPCRWRNYERSIECYLIIYAPIVLLLYFIYDVLWRAWADMFMWQRKVQKIDELYDAKDILTKEKE
jgi:hypothetical protein